ncbi:UNVERIFIED_CONTAM: hypothetical protein FKN15_014144 [Acipenser sinensis]
MVLRLAGVLGLGTAVSMVYIFGSHSVDEQGKKGIFFSSFRNCLNWRWHRCMRACCLSGVCLEFRVNHSTVFTSKPEATLPLAAAPLPV